MSRTESPFAVFATALAGLFLAVLLVLSPSVVLAGEKMPVTGSSPLAPPSQLDLRATLDDNDEMATLDAIHTALSQVGDGGTYVWHRQHGRLSGIFQPTQSFKDKTGAPCRHLVIMLVAGRHTQRTEGIACRLSNGRWQLDG